MDGICVEKHVLYWMFIFVVKAWGLMYMYVCIYVKLCTDCGNKCPCIYLSEVCLHQKKIMGSEISSCSLRISRKIAFFFSSLNHSSCEHAVLSEIKRITDWASLCSLCS